MIIEAVWAFCNILTCGTDRHMEKIVVWRYNDHRLETRLARDCYARLCTHSAHTSQSQFLADTIPSLLKNVRSYYCCSLIKIYLIQDDS
jgi:hypothetical protein